MNKGWYQFTFCPPNGRARCFIAQRLAESENDAWRMIDEMYPEFRYLSMTGFSGPYPQCLAEHELGWQE